MIVLIDCLDRKVESVEDQQMIMGLVALSGDQIYKLVVAAFRHAEITGETRDVDFNAEIVGFSDR